MSSGTCDPSTNGNVSKMASRPVKRIMALCGFGYEKHGVRHNPQQQGTYALNEMQGHLAFFEIYT